MGIPGETNHPLFVSVEDTDLKPCPSGEDSCKLWGSGILRITADQSNYNSTVILTAAGCEACSDTTMMHGDMGGIKSYSGEVHTTREAMLKDQIDRATVDLAVKVQTFLPSPDQDPQKFLDSPEA